MILRTLVVQRQLGYRTGSREDLLGRQFPRRDQCGKSMPREYVPKRQVRTVLGGTSLHPQKRTLMKPGSIVMRKIQVRSLYLTSGFMLITYAASSRQWQWWHSSRPQKRGPGSEKQMWHAWEDNWGSEIQMRYPSECPGDASAGDCWSSWPSGDP